MDPYGTLLIETGGAISRHHKPVAWEQHGNEAVSIPVQYRIEGRTVGFELVGHNPGFYLVIDPAIQYSTYLGGSGYDAVFGVAVDSTVNVYVTAETASADFPDPLERARIWTLL